jgi:lincosamide nucleotidyltransferase A/C/D/E
VPRRGRVLLSGIVYRNPPICSERVGEALRALDGAGIRAVLIGGWGVDALVGKQLRTHADLDLLVDACDLEPAVEAVQGLGFEPWNRDSSPGPIGETRVSVAQTLRDRALRVVEFHAVDLGKVDFVTGKLAGQDVLCLSADHQKQAQKVIGKTWTRRRRLNRDRNLAAVEGTLEEVKRA